jgi:hypothetical protein
MSTPVQPTTTINVDNAVFDVSKMSPEIQQMVRYFDEWRQNEADATSQVLMARNALQNLQNTLLQAIQKERDEAAKKAEALGLTAPAPAPAPAPEPAKKARKGGTQ